MHEYEVGHLYSQNVTTWPDGSSDYNWFADGHELRLFLSRPSSQETHDYNKGRAEFALVVTGSIISLLYRFGGQPWSDATFNYWLVPADRRPDKVEGWDRELARYLLQVVLIDASTGIIKALRAVTFSPEFSAQLAIAVRQQIEAGDPGPGYQKEIDRYLRDNPTAMTLLPKAIAKCTGGAE